MIFKSGYIFKDTKDGSEIKIIRSYSLRKKYKIIYVDLKTKKQYSDLRSDLLFAIENGTLKFDRVDKGA